MIKSSEIKKALKTKFGLSVRVRSSSGKAGWIEAWIPSEPYVNVRDPLVYKSEFPVEFRQRCLEHVYPNSPEVNTRTEAGNVRAHMIALLAHEWAAVLS